jgi:hypothetical protein
MYACTCVFIFIYIFIHIYSYIFIYIYIYINEKVPNGTFDSSTLEDPFKEFDEVRRVDDDDT